jgi:hypothetical protein
MGKNKGTRNPALRAALTELFDADIRVTRAENGRHIQLRWSAPDGRIRMYVLPRTPSDHRTPDNVRAGIRRLLREDNLLPSPEEKLPPPQPPKSSDRFALLEQRIAELEHRLAQVESNSHQAGETS